MTDFLKTAVLMLAWTLGPMHRVMTAIRRGFPRPFKGEPEWVVGLVIRTHKGVRSPLAQGLFWAACVEWERRHPVLGELWHLSVHCWHDTRLWEIVHLPPGSHCMHQSYQREGDRMDFTLALPHGKTITVLDKERVRVERIH